MFTLVPKQVKSAEFFEFQRAWYSQPSTASMTEDSIRTNCSDAVDSSGRYIWRENGKKHGRCCGIDFEQAGQKWRANKCSKDDIICQSAAISMYVPFAYDAGIALAHGLDKLVHREGLDRNEIAMDRLVQAIQNSTFDGVSGKVSFLINGDRHADQFEYPVYNYHETTRGFEVVGQVVDSVFAAVCEGGPCASMVFSDGSSSVPPVHVRNPYKPIARHRDRHVANSCYDTVASANVLNIACLQVVLVGGLFAQFSQDSNGAYVVDQAGVREMAAIQMAINRLNDKTDGIYDNLLPKTKVCLISRPYLL